MQNRRGRIYLDRGTILTNIVLSPLTTATIIGGITKVFPLFGCKKVSPTMLPWQITGSTASTYPAPNSLFVSIRCIHFFVVDYVRRLVSVLFSPFSFFFFYSASITIRQETYATSFKLQTVPTHASAWRQVR